jgi:hypothetical protein
VNIWRSHDKKKDSVIDWGFMAAEEIIVRSNGGFITCLAFHDF